MARLLWNRASRLFREGFLSLPAHPIFHDLDVLTMLSQVPIGEFLRSPLSLLVFTYSDDLNGLAHVCWLRLDGVRKGPHGREDALAQCRQTVGPEYAAYER